MERRVIGEAKQKFPRGKIKIKGFNDKFLTFELKGVIYTTFNKEIIACANELINQEIAVLDYYPKAQSYINKNGVKVWIVKMFVEQIEIVGFEEPSLNVDWPKD